MTYNFLEKPEKTDIQMSLIIRYTILTNKCY